MKFIKDWKAFTDNVEQLPTQECLYDLECSLRGVVELTKLSEHPIRPAYINSDLVELHFSQVRHLFNNQIPNLLQYQSVQNSIILGQPYAFAGAKSNTGVDAYPKPVSMYATSNKN